MAFQGICGKDYPLSLFISPLVEQNELSENIRR
jgi:hypothetical protein